MKIEFDTGPLIDVIRIIIEGSDTYLVDGQCDDRSPHIIEFDFDEFWDSFEKYIKDKRIKTITVAAGDMPTKCVRCDYHRVQNFDFFDNQVFWCDGVKPSRVVPNTTFLGCRADWCPLEEK